MLSARLSPLAGFELSGREGRDAFDGREALDGRGASFNVGSEPLSFCSLSGSASRRHYTTHLKEPFHLLEEAEGLALRSVRRTHILEVVKCR